MFCGTMSNFIVMIANKKEALERVLPFYLIITD